MELANMLKKGNGKAYLTTVNGEKLFVSMNEKKIVLTDGKGVTSIITIKDVYQSNGVIHVIDTVVMPK